MSHRFSLLRILAAACLAAAACATALTPGALADGLQVQSATPWMQNAAPMGWSASLNRVIYNSVGANGMFNAYSANPDGGNPTCLTCTVPSFPGLGAATNRGATDVSPDGRYMLLSVERPHPGQIGAAWTQPGKGADDDVWLATTDGTQAWPLTNIDAPSQQAYGTMWARFDRTGNEIVWASMYAPAVFNLGFWQLKVADIVWTNGVPSLADIRTIEPSPGQFYEPYGFSPDDSHIIFASSVNMPSWTDNEIDTININGTGLTQLSPPNAPGQILGDYDEFAFYTPDGNWIVYGSTHDTLSGGMDYWIMHPDGSDAQRLTYFNAPWNTESMGYTVVGGLAFNPDNPDQFIADVANNSNADPINAEEITLAPQSTSNALTEQLYANENFGQLVSTTTGDPAAGFEADGSPAPGMPSTGYSIRWSGTVTPPASGTYQFCIVAEYSAELYVDGSLVVNGMYSYGQRRCAAVAETAGMPTSIVMDYIHGTGTAWAQLSWIPPGATAAGPVTASLLSPAEAATAPAAGGSTSATTGNSTSAPPAATAATHTTTTAAGTTAAKTASSKTATAKKKRQAGPRATVARKLGERRGHAKRRGHAAVTRRV